ncbi:hypothetical protein [Micromonospora sp. WMMD980]|uniref:FDXHR family putative zinc-binding protein n=1 Tax=Micromonospora sp. WMMD980 TaxID=3016088 RepID=UPI002417159C|nr:hypothetical protein [Micromonospora sp. WMMD980]MDG4801706.1 hypothetical protein [Micromonospora sp. WMMD980]
MTTCACGVAWTGLSIAHCGTCHCTFSAVSTFDRHRTGNVNTRRCVPPESVGLARNRHGVYRTPSDLEPVS